MFFILLFFSFVFSEKERVFHQAMSKTYYVNHHKYNKTKVNLFIEKFRTIQERYTGIIVTHQIGVNDQDTKKVNAFITFPDKSYYYGFRNSTALIETEKIIIPILETATTETFKFEYFEPDCWQWEQVETIVITGVASFVGGTVCFCFVIICFIMLLLLGCGVFCGSCVLNTKRTPSYDTLPTQ